MSGSRYGAAGDSGDEERSFQASSEGVSAAAAPSRRRWGVLVGIGLTAVTMAMTAVAAAAAARTPRPAAATTSLSDVSSDVGSSLKKLGSISSANRYTVSGQEAPGALYPFLVGKVLVEPHRHTRLAFDADDAVSVDTSSAVWTVEQVSNKRSLEAHGVRELSGALAWNITFASLGNYEAILRFTYKDTSAVSTGVAVTTTVSQTLFCRYVRRSLRGMATDERDAFFDAIKYMMDVGREEGQQRYGLGYRDLNHFLSMHLAMAADRASDKLHDGMGFVTQHIALTTEFEGSVQAISPHIAVPYWDYTYDWYLANQSATPLETLWTLDVWQPTWFGKAEGELHTVTEGRFAYVEVASNFSAEWRSPYGYLRAPWNVNKSPYLTRHHSFCGASYTWQDSSLYGGTSATTTSWPSCQAHHQLTFNMSTWYDWVWYASYAPHGPVHFMIGGYGNCGDIEEDIPALSNKATPGGVAPTNEEAVKRAAIVGMIKESLLDIPKNMWRYFMADFPDYCSMDTPASECHMACAEPVDMDWYRLFITGNHTMGKVLFGDWISKFPKDQTGPLMDYICSTPFSPGEQMEAASPIDPSFWPIHPTMERLLHYKRIVEPFDDARWLNNGDDDDTTFCIYADTVGSECMGHHAEDTTFWESKYEDEEGNFVKKFLTNGEVFRIGEPNSVYKLPYVYDNFAWPHCDASGFAFRSKSRSFLAQEQDSSSER